MADRSTSAARGFTAIELMLVVALIGLTAGIAAMVTPIALTRARADGGFGQVLAATRTARELAIGQRRNIQIEFINNNQVRTSRIEVPGPATTVLSTVNLEGRVQYVKFAALPDTPDLFGAGAAVSFGATPSILFTSEGSFVDAAGDPLNGTVFMGVPGDPSTARAVTIFGATAVIRAWRWDGRQWVVAD